MRRYSKLLDVREAELVEQPELTDRLARFFQLRALNGPFRLPKTVQPVFNNNSDRIPVPDPTSATTDAAVKPNSACKNSPTPAGYFGR